MRRLTARVGVLWFSTLACAAVIAAALAPVANAHSSFLESTPAPGAQLATSPARIVMVYTEPLNERLTTVRLIDAASERPVTADVRILERRRLELVPRGRLAQGAYRIDWRSVSTIDAHIREGAVGFGVGTAALGASVEISGSPLDGAGPARVALRWLFYAALFFFAGGALNAARRRGRGSPGSWLAPANPSAEGVDPALAKSVGDRAWRRTAIGAWIALLAAVATVALESGAATGGLAPGAWAEFLTTGMAGFSRLGFVAALLVAAVFAVRSPTGAAVAALGAFVAMSLGGHASGADPGWLAVATNLTHLVAAAIWVGGIAQLAWAWLPALRGGGRPLRRAVVSGVLPRFGRVALPAFAVVAITGLVNALMQLGHISQLWSSAYGRVLFLKALLVMGIALISYLHAFRLRPRILLPETADRGPERLERMHRRLLGSETVVAVSVLAASAVLVAFPVPPREALKARAALGSVKACDPCPFAAPVAGELTVGAPLGDLTAGVWMRRAAGEITGTLRVINGDRDPVAVPVSIAGATSIPSCGRGCWRFRLPGSTARVRISAETDAGTARADLPARWDESGDARAQRLLSRTQRRMRDLRTLRMAERVESAKAGGRVARGEYEFQAPDRMRFIGETNDLMTIDRQGWLRPGGSGTWMPLAPAEAPFRVRDAFRWTVFASTVRLLRADSRTAELALFDYGYPVWYRVTIDRRTGLARRETLVSPENRIDHRFSGFNAPIEISPPSAP